MTPDEREAGEKCQRCGKRYLTVWQVSDDLWEWVTGITNGSGLYCMNCFDEMARQKKINLYCACHSMPFPKGIIKI